MRSYLRLLVRLLLLLLFLEFSGLTSRAAPAPADTLRPVSPTRLLRYTYANDLFFRTDYHFTQGMTLMLVHLALARLPVRHLLAAGSRGSTRQHGLTLHYDGFTLLRIQDAFIRVDDRPYAAYLYASLFRIRNQPTRHQRLTTALEIGFIGPAAGGKELQTAIHRVTGNAAPRGWNYQIRNAPIVGYRVDFEKQLLAVGRHAEMVANTEASLGTLSTLARACICAPGNSIPILPTRAGPTVCPTGNFMVKRLWPAASLATMPLCRVALFEIATRTRWQPATFAEPYCAAPAA